MTDQIRSDSARRRRETDAAMSVGYTIPPIEPAKDADEDDTLILLFMCCHPALSTSSAIALTLRAVGGLTTAEIARAFLVPEATMAQRISRAKQSIKESKRPFRLPRAEERARSLKAVMHVLYLMFNEGYSASSGDQFQRTDLANEAIQLTRAVHMKAENEPEVAGLLSLMLLTDARRLARSGPNVEMIPLDKQDRGLWNREQIEEGIALLSAALPRGAVGPYQLQAAIAAVHDEAKRPQDTDWPQILALYDLLQRMSDNPIVKLNRAIAFAMVHGAAQGLALLKPLDADPRLAGHHRLHAARGHLLEMAGDQEGAAAEYRLAALKTASMPERNYLLTQAASVSGLNSAPPRS